MAASEPTSSLFSANDILQPLTLSQPFGALTAVWVVPLSEAKFTPGFPSPKLAGCHILSWTTGRHLSVPKPVIRRFTVTAAPPEARLRPTSIGTSYHPDSMGFLPLAAS